MNSSIEDYVLVFSDDCNDVIAFTETWLDDRTVSGYLFGNEYEGFRCDRSSFNSLKRTGGGVLIAVRRRLKAHVICDPTWNTLEQIWVSVQLTDRKLFICIVYFPPDRTRDKQLIDTHLQSVSSITARANPRVEIIIIGDYNLPSLFWRPACDGFYYPDPDQSTSNACAMDLLDGYNAAGLQQINGNPNENGRCLDLCFVSICDTAPNIAYAPDPLVKTVPHHPALVLSLDNRYRIDPPISANSIRFNFRRADYDGLSSALRNVDWITVLNHTDIDLAVNDFTSVCTELLERFVPKARHRKYLPWQSSTLRRLKSMKKAALRRFSANGTLCLREHYRQLNNEYKKLGRRCYSNYRRLMESKLKTDPKKFWNFVNMQRKQSGLPSSMELAGEKADNCTAICRLFADKFSSVFNSETLTNDQVLEAANNVPSYGQSIASINIDDSMILTAASKLKHSYSPGPDGIPATLLKKCITDLLIPLSFLFRLSLSSGRFPTAWKHAFLFPVYKKGDRTKIDNYRGIFALCAISKLFELIVLQPIFAHCQNNIADEQHGFLPKRSCTTNLLCLTSFVIDSFIDRSQTDTIYTDLSAAFDKINHRIAVAKLDRYGFCGSLLCWLESYLVRRTLSVKINDIISKSFSAFSGIAQGSHLGLLVFLLYFNDVHYSLKCPRLAFADDLKLFNKIKHSADAAFLQEQLNIFASWCEINRMVLNPSKCSVITFTRKHRPLKVDYFLNGSPVQRVVLGPMPAAPDRYSSTTSGNSTRYARLRYSDITGRLSCHSASNQPACSN
ncbi:uncharacterized protein LOC129717021 [Wyeomyia smithii]|uniref:uncharacterized protein LOC129717021 n=1 Tax=Wyeomyia smithii TaxID=174621 RepID=UPI00246812EA|nr:uncharacterized protein LOC129717021 [Wyeomyia smithii]